MGRTGNAADGIRRVAGACLLSVLLGLPVAAAHAASDAPARLLFGRVDAPAALAPGVIGSYAKGCLAGGARLADVGPGYQTMRPSRNRAWGHPSLLAFLKELAVDLKAAGHKPMLIGDLAQPRGGPMLSGHASHQSGLDVDIWFRPSPDFKLTRKQREEWSAYSVVKSVKAPWVNEKFTAREAKLIELAARDRRTARVFVAASIKQALCVAAPATDRAWLRKVRAWYGHKDHLHVRLHCPAGSETCKRQKPPPPGDGCGDELASWLNPPPPPKTPPPTVKPKLKQKRKEITLAQLPAACAGVLDAAAVR